MSRSLALILVFISVINAQARREKKDIYQVFVNMPDHSIRTSVLAEPAKVNADLDRTYYWYASNRILGTLGGYDGKLLHGDYTSFYLNNSLREKGLFKKGLKHGKWISWYENGKIKDITNWRNGKRDGSFYSFTETGLPVLEARFSNDVLHGKMTSYENGKILSKKKYRKGEEIVKEVKPPGEKKIKRVKETDKPISKEGINATTLPKEKKKTLKDRWRSLIMKKDQPVEDEKIKKSDKPLKEEKKKSIRTKKTTEPKN